MALLRRLYEKLHLSVNESKSAVASAFGRKFLGYAFWASPKGVKRAVAVKAREQFKQRIRVFTRRSGGRSLQQIADNLRPYLIGWKAYFGLSQTPKVWRKLDEWIRHRMRAIQLKQWRRGSTVYRELRRLGVSDEVAKKVAVNTRCWWRNSRLELNRVFDIAWFDRLGLVRLS
jgi:RNA-directed DNA polymerase